MRKSLALLLMALLLTSTTLAGCLEGSDPDNQTNEVQTTLVSLEAASTSDCANGGTLIHSGLDTDGDGTLSTSEITATQAVCNGAAGADGSNGANGADGSNGANGANGADGADGADGAWHAVHGAPC